MTRIYSEQEVVARVRGLSVPLLLRFIEAEIVRPVSRGKPQARGYAKVDVARLRLACELAEEFDLDTDALGLVMGLIDRLHATRADLRALMRAVAAEPEDVRARIAATVRRAG